MNITVNITVKQATILQQGLTALGTSKFTPAVGQRIGANLLLLAVFLQQNQALPAAMSHEIALGTLTIEDLNLGQNHIAQTVLAQIQPLLKPQGI